MNLRLVIIVTIWMSNVSKWWQRLQFVLWIDVFTINWKLMRKYVIIVYLSILTSMKQLTTIWENLLSHLQHMMPTKQIHSISRFNWTIQLNSVSKIDFTQIAVAVMHVGIANPRWWGKRSRQSRRMRNLQFCVSGKKLQSVRYWFCRLALELISF